MKLLSKFSKRISLGLQPYCTAVVAAGGNSTRMGGENKLLATIGGKPVIVHTLLALEQAKRVKEIVIATRADDIPKYAALCKQYGIKKVSKVVIGGSTRVESVFNGILQANNRAKLIAVHDAARPFATPELIDRVIERANLTLAAAPAIAVHDTIKIAQDGVVTSTPQRENLFAVQTPQVFDASVLCAALQYAMQKNLPVTDDCSAVEKLGKQVYLVDGDEQNFKITTKLDLVLAEKIMEDKME